MAGSPAGTPASAGRAGTPFVRPRLAYCESERCHLFPMWGLNGRPGAFRRRSGDEAKAAWPTVFVIQRQVDFGAVAMGGKQIHQAAAGGGGNQIVHV